MIIFGAPKRYVQGEGALSIIGAELANIGKNVAFVVDKRTRPIVEETILNSCQQSGVAATFLDFGGEITYAEVDRLAALSSGKEFDVVVSAGGGKAIDTGKLLSRAINAAFVSIPTIASNDSPTSHIAVVYDENHKLVGVEENKGNPELVLVDTAIIVKAPKTFLSAGVGDAFVKKFEVEQCIGANGKNVFGAQSPLTALALARACYDTLREHTEKAFEAVDNGKTTPEFEAIVEASVLMSGLAFESGGLSVSHGMTRGLSAIPNVADALHGHQVAYGLLVQLVLEGRSEEFLNDIRSFYRVAGLPLKLADLGHKGTSNSDIDTISELSASAVHMKKFEKSISATDIAKVIVEIEGW